MGARSRWEGDDLATRLDFARVFAKRMLIVSAFVGAVIGLLFPALHFLWVWKDFTRTADILEDDFVRRARTTIRANPELWYYNISKFVELADEAGHRGSVAEIRVYDRGGVLRSSEIISEAAKITYPFRAAVRDNNETVGYIEVFFDIKPLLAETFALTAALLIAGLAVGFFLYRYPVTLVELAEQAVKQHADEARRQAETEVARLERLSLVGQMAASIGHEVRNPLTTVKGYLQLFARRKGNADNAHQLQLMLDELDRANAIISEFLSLSSNKAVQKRACSLNHIVEALFPLIQSDALLRDQYALLDQRPLPEIFVDEKEIRQLILNITRNGLEAMEKGGRLTIRTYEDGEAVVLEIVDQGKGIESTVLDKLGTPFVTTKETGTGLGLAISYSIAHRQGASIVFHSSPGGTTCSIHFTPATDNAAGPTTA